MAQTGGNARQCVKDLALGYLVENSAEVAAVEESEVFEIDEFRQGSPPDRPGREG